MTTCAILGVGLIGGSLAKALAGKGYELRLYDMQPILFDSAHATVCSSASEAVSDADIIVFATSIPALALLCQEIASHIKPGAIVTDVTSVKQPFLDATAVLPQGTIMLPAHPIAGKEVGGFAASEATLFHNAKVILSPPAPDAPGIELVKSLWQTAGAHVEFMPAEMHDRIYACVSHLPQYLAFALKDTGLVDASFDDATYRRFTRLCHSPRELWDGIFAANQTHLTSLLKYYTMVLHQIAMELREGSATQAPASTDIPLAKMLPYVLAGCLISTTYRLERDLGLPKGISPAKFAGSGFRDFTAPAVDYPAEAMLTAISAVAAELAAELERFAQALERV